MSVDETVKAVHSDSQRNHTDGQGFEHQVFVARQPVFDISKAIHGYELLYHQPDGEHREPDSMTRATICHAVHEIGFERLLHGKTAFINVTADTLCGGDYQVLPPKQSVLELDATNDLSSELRYACQQARQSGYRIALDNYVPGQQGDELVALADILKVNFQNVDIASPGSLSQLRQASRQVLLADKVDTHEKFKVASDVGFDLVQGFFFCQPEVVAGKGVAPLRTCHLQLLQALNQPEIDLGRIEQVIKSDVGLSYRILRYINSASMGVRHKVTTIHQALVMLGAEPLRKWGTLAVLSDLAGSKPKQLLITSLSRAHFCEAIARHQKRTQDTLNMFFVGMLSVIDAILNTPMAEAISQLPVSEEVTDVLLGKSDGYLGRALALARASETGAWATVSSLCHQMDFTQGEVANLYYQTLQSTYELVGE